MRVIVTRPEPSARATVEKLRALGHDPVLLPLFRAEHLPGAVRDALSIPAGGLIFTSAEACRALAATNGDLRTLRDKPVYAVGQSTARAAAKLGFRMVVTGNGDGAALAARIENAERSDLPLVYIAGEPRSPELEITLAARKIPFRTVVAYKMSALAHPAHDVAATLATAEAILLYSAGTAKRLLDLAGPDPAALAGKSVYCLSPSIARAFAAPQGTLLHVAETPDEACLLALLPGGDGKER
nr:uroporphyrinogen-III synthase [uncultured Gellertiella sp.]